MTASIIKCKCPKCGATVIVDASSDHTTCVWCGTSIPNVLAKESEIQPVAEGVEVERPRIDKEKFDESNTNGWTLNEAAATPTEILAGADGEMFSRWVSTSTFLIGLAAYWFPHLGPIGKCYNSIGTYAFVAQAIVLLLLGMVGGVLRWRVSFAGVVGFIIGGWLFDVILDLNWPTIFPCGHNLLPFEAVIVFVVIPIPFLLGLPMGKLLRRFWPTHGHFLANVLIVLSGATALLSSMLLLLELWVNEHRAQAMITKLAQAQVDFKAQHNDIGYACRFSDISDSLSETLPNSAKGRFYEATHSGDYSYWLWCYKDVPQRNNFAIEAMPSCSYVCLGKVAYCVRADGKIRSLPFKKNEYSRDDCWTKGKVVTTITR